MQMAYGQQRSAGERWRSVRLALRTPAVVTPLAMAVPALLGLLAGYINLHVLASAASSRTPLVGALVGSLLFVVSELGPVVARLVIVFLMESAAHEMGHLVAGRLAGFRLMRYISGPIKITGTDKGIHFGFNESWDQYAGSVICVPTHWHNVRWRAVALTAGGPLGSLTLGLSALALNGMLSAATPLGATAKAVLETTTFMSLISFALNALPIKSNGYLSDGARIKMLLRGGPAAERWCAILALVGASKNGLRPREWATEWVERATAPADGSIDDAGATHIAFYWALDRGDIALAEEMIQKTLAASGKGPSIMRPVVSADAAFFYAYYRKDPQTARYFLGLTGGNVVRRYRYMLVRAEAATLLAEGRVEEGRAHAYQGWAEMEQEGGYDPGGVQQEREWFSAMSGVALG